MRLPSLAFLVAALLTGLLAGLVAPSFGAGAAAPRFVTGQAAVTVVGQKNFSANIPGAAADELGTVTGLAVAGNRLIVCDGGLPFLAPNNHRILIFPNLSELGVGAAAAVVIGQPEFGKNTPGLSEKSFNNPIGISTDGQRLAVADTNNNRVLIFNRIPTENGAAAELVVGQSDFKSSAAGVGRGGLRAPNGVFLDGQRLFVADTGNHRVLIFNSLPASNGAQADVVLGQADFNARADQAASATSLRDPTSAFTDGLRLIVADLGHNRVLIWNRVPTSNNAAADVVIGQPDFNSEAAGTGPASLDFPRHAFLAGGRLFLADAGNNRILIYEQLPTSNGVAADVVLGQADFRTATAPGTAPDRLTAGDLSTPLALASSGSGILVADTGHRRVLRFVPGLPLFDPGSVLSAANFGGNGLARVTGVQVEVQAEGELPAGTYYIKVTAEGGILFESTPSEEVQVTVPDKSKLVVTFDEVAGATSYRVYLGGSPGGQNRFYPTETPAAGQPINRSVTISSLAVTYLNVGGPRLEITPGSIAVLFGRDLAGETAVASELPLPRELAGTSLLINGVPAPLFFVSPTQINFQVPWETAGWNASVVVEKRTPEGIVVSTAVPVPISDLTPGVFTVSGDGTGSLLAFHADFTPVDDTNPLEPGQTIIFFATGVQSVGPLGDALGAATLDTSQKGEIKATSEGDVSWSISFSSNARVFVSTDGDPEALFAEGQKGNQKADFIAPGRVFRFILRPLDDGVVGPIVAIAVVDTRGEPTGEPTGQIEVASEGLVTWSTSNVAAARVYVSIDGGAESVFAEGTEGSIAATFIEPGHLYRFALRQLVNGLDGATLAQATLDTFVAVADERSGQISVDSQGKLTWSTTNVSAARVYLSTDGGPESVYAEGTSGEEAPDQGFFKAGHLYRFFLRIRLDKPPAADGEPSPAGTTIHTTMSASIQGRDAPILFGGLAPGFVGLLQFNVKVADELEMNGEPTEVKLFVGSIPANLTYLPVKDAATGEITATPEGEITWSASNTAGAQVFFSIDGGEEVFLAEGLSGSLKVDFIERGHLYTFVLRKYVNGQVGKVLATATVDTRT